MINTRPPTVIFDLDGTLVNVSSIRHHITNIETQKNFDAFHRDAVNCPPIPWVAQAAKDAERLGFTVIQLTARAEKYKASTSWWIAENDIPSHGLYMRTNKDYRPDYVIKKEIVDRLLKRYDIVKAYDDNPNVVALWNEYKIPCVVVPGWEV